ncbi:MAG: hypothetical protein GX829_03175 [Clostridium sp.]|nr:hypothetical protein [Clostridium sp.]
MTDRELKSIEGRWFLQYSGCPLWLRGNVDTISFNYELEHKGEELVLKERIEFRKNGKMKMKRGFEIPSDDSEFLQWKGIGMNKFFRNKSKILHYEEALLVMWFEKTVSTPESIDVLTRQKNLNANESIGIIMKLEEIPNVNKHLSQIESVNIL